MACGSSQHIRKVNWNKTEFLPVSISTTEDIVDFDSKTANWYCTNSQNEEFKKQIQHLEQDNANLKEGLPNEKMRSPRRFLGLDRSIYRRISDLLPNEVAKEKSKNKKTIVNLEKQLKLQQSNLYRAQYKHELLLDLVTAKELELHRTRKLNTEQEAMIVSLCTSQTGSDASEEDSQSGESQGEDSQSEDSN